MLKYFFLHILNVSLCLTDEVVEGGCPAPTTVRPNKRKGVLMYCLSSFLNRSVDWMPQNWWVWAAVSSYSLIAIIWQHYSIHSQKVKHFLVLVLVFTVKSMLVCYEKAINDSQSAQKRLIWIHGLNLYLYLFAYIFITTA